MENQILKEFYSKEFRYFYLIKQANKNIIPYFTNILMGAKCGYVCNNYIKKIIELHDQLNPILQKRNTLLKILFDNPIYFYFNRKKKKRLMKLYNKLIEKGNEIEKMMKRYDLLSNYHQKLFKQYQ